MQNAEAEIVQLVEDLVKSYVVGNCLILVTLPMSGKSFLSETRPSTGVLTVDAVQTTLKTRKPPVLRRKPTPKGCARSVSA